MVYYNYFIIIIIILVLGLVYVVLRHLKQYFRKPWWSVLLMEGTGGPEDNHRLVASH